MDWKELVGYLAPVFIVASMSQTILKRIRILMILGCLTFVVYGILVGAWPVVIANALIGLVTLYYLLGAKEEKHPFQLTEPKEFLNFYLDERKSEIEQRVSLPFPPDTSFMMMTKGIQPVGLFAYRPGQNGSAEILLDYVEPAYRDAESETILYCKNQGLLKQKGFAKAIVKKPSEIAREEFTRLGFNKAGNDLVKDLTREGGPV